MVLTVPTLTTALSGRGDSFPSVMPEDGQLRSFAVELHDGLAQELFAARMNLDEITASIELPDDARAALDQLSMQLAGTSHTLRTALLRCFHDTGRRPSGLSPEERVRNCVREFEGAHGIPAAVMVCGSGPVPGPTGTDLLVRTVREALANVAKHAGASRAAVTLERGPQRWSVNVEDDGSGDAASVRRRTRRPSGLSFGLASLADQAVRVSGGLAVGRSEHLAGIAVTMTVPVDGSTS